MNPTEKKLSKARTRMLTKQPFFGCLAIRMKLIEVPHEIVDTMATDGTHCYYSATFVTETPDDELIGVLAHEVMHCALGHHARRGDRDLEQWNVACDYAINPIITSAGLKLPAFVLSDPKYAGMSAEEIYNARRREKNGSQTGSQGARGSQGSPGGQQSQGANAGGQAGPSQAVPKTKGGIGQVIDAVTVDPSTGKASKASPAESQRQADEWKILAEQSARNAKGIGNMPGDVNRAIEAAKQERVDWRETLRRFISETEPRDYSWSRPNRRFVGSGLYLPSAVREGVGEIVVAIDTSGSINDAALAQCGAELNAIASEARPDLIHVLYCDRRVAHVDEFEAGDEITLNARGGGGTCFKPPFAYVEQQGITPKAMIYLTDLMCHSYPDEPAYPVLWVTDTKEPSFIPPFGEMVYIDE